VTDLVVTGDVLFRGIDVDVIAQAVEQLRPIGLRVDRFEQGMLYIGAALRPVGFWIHVQARCRPPFSGKPPQRPKIGQRVGIDVRRLGENVVRKIGHGASLSAISRF